MTITNDYTDDFIQRVREQAAAVLLEAGFLLQTTLKGQLSTSYPPASIPGQYPHGRTWTGRDAVVVQPSDPREVARLGYVQIGFTANAWYMGYLETDKQRLGLFYTFEQLKPAIRMILEHGGMKASAQVV